MGEIDIKKITYKDINIVYEDNHILVVVKPHNIPVQADSSNDPDMLSLLKEYLVKTYDKPNNAYLGLVHRLDRVTGGVMVFAKTSKAASRLSEQFRSHFAGRSYIAILEGVLKEKNNTLVDYVKKDTTTNIVKVVPNATTGAKKAILDYTLINQKNGMSLVRVKLSTGRTHQIRVQFSNIKAPVLGDVKYGNGPISTGSIALWAYEVKLEHPTTKQNLIFRVFPDTQEYPWKDFNVDSFLNITIKNIY